MAKVTNPGRSDPYKNFKFRVIWDGHIVAGVSRISALKRTTEAVVHREGGEPSTSRVSPGRSRYEAITLERGVTNDAAFEDWANQVWRLGASSGGEVTLSSFRKDIAIEVLDEAGNVALRYLVHRCWVSEYTALPDLNGESNAVLIASITLEHEGWMHDTSVAEARGATPTRA
jgi:phage tail-like protein